MNWQTLLFVVLLAAILLYSKLRHKLTDDGLLAAALTGILVYIAFGLPGIAIMGSFFLLGNLVTSWKLNFKEKIGAVDNARGIRNGRQVFANGGVAALLAMICVADRSLFTMTFMMMAASLSSATADTLSSELGTVYGKRFYNVISFRPDKRGENGVVSLQGTLFGLLGSLIIAVIFFLTASNGSADSGTLSSGDPLMNSIIVVVAGTFGNFSDSVLGATLERRNQLKNNGVNFLNTALAAAFALILWQVTR